MRTYDFSQSFVTFATRGYENQARIQIEAVCHLTDQEQGTTEDYYLVASCKAEDTHGSGVLFVTPNYDFSAIFSATEYFIIRVGVPHDLKKNSVGRNTDFFEEVRIAPMKVPGEELETSEAIVQATLANRRLNGYTEMTDPTGRFHVTIAYPIKTINVNDRRDVYQVDTGPLLLHDPTPQKKYTVEHFRLAFIAYNEPQEAFFVIQEPTPVVPDRPDVPKVSHYSRVIGQMVKNSVVAI
jgi:hypothetical protein